MGLTVRQMKFVDYYIELGDATKAAIKAGYSAKYAGSNADKLLKNTKVKAYLDKRLEEVESERIAKPVEVLKFLTSVMRGETTAQVVVSHGLGFNKVDKAPDEKERLRAAELLGKRYRLFTDNMNIEGVQINFTGEGSLAD